MTGFSEKDEHLNLQGLCHGTEVHIKSNWNLKAVQFLQKSCLDKCKLFQLKFGSIGRLAAESKCMQLHTIIKQEKNSKNLYYKFI